VERWNELQQHVMDAVNIISFKNKFKRIRETRMGFFYGSPLNPMSLTCGLITVEATPRKEPGKESVLHCNARKSARSDGAEKCLSLRTESSR